MMNAYWSIINWNKDIVQWDLTSHQGAYTMTAYKLKTDGGQSQFRKLGSIDFVL